MHSAASRTPSIRKTRPFEAACDRDGPIDPGSHGGGVGMNMINLPYKRKFLRETPAAATPR
jgi:hypothetical protein